MTTRILQTLADELRVWRVTLVDLRDVKGIEEIDELIRHIDAAIEAIANFHAKAAIKAAAG